MDRKSLKKNTRKKLKWLHLSHLLKIKIGKKMMTITEMRVISTEMKTDMVLRLTQMTVVWEDTRWEQHLFSIR